MAEMSLKDFVKAMKEQFDNPTFGWKVTGKDGQVFQNSYPKNDGDKEKRNELLPVANANDVPSIQG